MLLPLLALAALQVKPAPVVPPGCNAHFHQAVLQIEQKLEAGDFVAAERLLPLLPVRKVPVWWDDTKVPVALRSEFAEARDKGMKQVTGLLKDISFDIGAPQPRLKVSFAESLPPETEGAMPPGAVYMVSPSPTEPRVEVVISLKRGLPAQPTQAFDVQSEVQTALGVYFGLAESSLPSGMMYRVDSPWGGANRASTRDLKMIQNTLKVSDELRAAVAQKQRLQAAQPQLLLNPLKLTLEPGVQGAHVPFSIQATNQGNSKLQILVAPDCGCVVSTQWLELGPDETGLLKGFIDTTEYFGDLKKTIVIMSNDVDYPVRNIPLEIRVEPRYRLVMPGGPVVLMADGGASVDVYLYTPEGKGFDLTEVRLDGLPGTVDYKPWSGMLADPDMNEPEKARKGYKFNVELKDMLPPGRSTATLVIGTKDEGFPVLRHNLSAQKGIVALPESIWFGEIGRAPRRSVFLLSRPERPFKVTKIEADNPSLLATLQPLRGEWEYKVTVMYNGTAEFGNLESFLTIHTNDPKQPKILVQVRGVVR